MPEIIKGRSTPRITIFDEGIAWVFEQALRCAECGAEFMLTRRDREYRPYWNKAYPMLQKEGRGKFWERSWYWVEFAVTDRKVYVRYVHARCPVCGTPGTHGWGCSRSDPDWIDYIREHGFSGDIRPDPLRW